MSAGAELSSINAALDGLAVRISGLAESMSGTQRDDVAANLYEVERALGAAQRRLAKIVDELV